MFDRSDGLFMHLMLRHLRPSRVIEIGSGYSSACVLDTVERFIPGVHCTFVDPNADVLRSVLRPEDYESVEIVELPVQRAPLERYSQLDRGDLLFIDSTHVVKVGSDVNHLFFDVLPTLRSRVSSSTSTTSFRCSSTRGSGFESRGRGPRATSCAHSSSSTMSSNSFSGPRCSRASGRRAYARFHPPTKRDTGGSLYMRRRTAAA